MHGGDVTLGEIKVVVVFRKDMRDQEAVVFYRHGGFQTRYDELFFALVSGGLHVLPEAVIGIEKLAQRRNGNASDCPAAVHEKNQEKGNDQAGKKLRKFHSVSQRIK